MNSVIGKNDAGSPVKIDILRLVETRMLVEANSGGGKSFALRKLLEVTHGKVQQIVLDMEGDFPTLREKFDYILAGKDGDIPADPRSAELLARKILELGASIIIDLYELKHDQRIDFVKRFLEAMINAPKELWHPVLVVLDEAHIFMPEKGECEAAGAVIDLATRGRKRGYCLVAATQRLSKLDKDGAAELNNKLIGRTGLDIDQKRASEELGFTSKEQMHSLRDLEPGEFFIFGPALSRQVTKIKVDSVITTHPRAGQRMISVVPKPTDKILKDLAKLTDLPKEAEKELKTKEEMVTRIRELKHEVRELRTGAGKPQIDEKALKQVAEANYAKGWKAAASQATEVNRKLKAAYQTLRLKIDRAAAALGTKVEIPEIKLDLEPPKHVAAPIRVPIVSRQVAPRRQEEEATEYLPEGGEVKYDRCARMILKFLLTQPDRSFTKPQIGAMTKYSPRGGGFNNSLSLLRKQRLIVQKGDTFSINPDELERAQDISKDIDLGSLNDWLNTLGRAEREIFKVLKEHPDTDYTREDLGQESGYAASGGGFNNAISHLCTLGLAERTNGGGVRFNQEITEWLEA